jgi:hypothetical protein
MKKHVEWGWAIKQCDGSNCIFDWTDKFGSAQIFPTRKDAREYLKKDFPVYINGLKIVKVKIQEV